MTELTGQSHRAEHLSLHKANRYAATIVMNILDDLLPIDSVLDLGCGLGTWLEVCLSTKNRCQVLGIEIEEFSADDLMVEPWRILNVDLAEPVDLHRRFDLVLCLETAEHLNPSAANNLVGTCARHSDVVLFSAALPGQGGLHHVNEQLPEYWVNLFLPYGFDAIDLIRPLIWNDRQIPVWYRQNMMLFARRESTAAEKLRRTVSQAPLGRAHPDLLQMFANHVNELEHKLECERDAAEVALRENTEELKRELRDARTDAAICARRELQLILESERRSSQLARLQEEHENLQAELQILRDRSVELLKEIRTANLALAAMQASTSWRVSAPVRWLGTALPNSRRIAAKYSRAQPRSSDPHDTAGVPAVSEQVVNLKHSPDKTGQHAPRLKVVFISGEPATPGHRYRIAYMAGCLPRRPFETVICDLEEAPTHAAAADILWFWRVPWSEAYENIVSVARGSGASVFYDIDDLMFRPELARIDVIDGIRTQQLKETDIEALYARIHKALCLADLCIAPTQALAQELYKVFPGPVWVVPNGFPGDALRRAEAARQSADAELSDGLIRIGYASGTLTHQRDFAAAASALIAVLTEIPEARLVLFEGTIDLSEFPELTALESQIEWRKPVPLEELLYEYARFDINILPLEVGNRFCEAKSELKFFEAALVRVPTIASPTETLRLAVEDGVTGYLAPTQGEWHRLLRKLTASDGLRKQIGERARNVVIWRNGPERRSLTLRRISGCTADKSSMGAMSIAVLRDAPQTNVSASIPECEIVFQKGRRGRSRVAVIMPLFNYGHFVTEALDSVLAQTERNLDLIIVDDCSTDDSLKVAADWLTTHGNAFNHAALLKNGANSKLGATRNAAVHFARTELYLPLDPDNVLQPLCVERLVHELDETGAAFAYPLIESFGDTGGRVWHLSSGKWDPNRLKFGNYIDAMALVRTACWSAVGGYIPSLYGWEDYDFWCSFVEQGFFGADVPEVFARYRYHQNQMIRTVTAKHNALVNSHIMARHPWLRLENAPMPDVEVPKTPDAIPAE